MGDVKKLITQVGRDRPEPRALLPFPGRVTDRTEDKVMANVHSHRLSPPLIDASRKPLVPAAV